MPTLAISISAQGTNTTTYTFSGPDAQRYFNAWKTRVGPKDPAGNPIGTQKQMTTWAADQVMVALDHLITTTEQQAVVPPDKTSAES